MRIATINGLTQSMHAMIGEVGHFTPAIQGGQETNDRIAFQQAYHLASIT